MFNSIFTLSNNKHLLIYLEVKLLIHILLMDKIHRLEVILDFTRQVSLPICTLLKVLLFRDILTRKIIMEIVISKALDLREVVATINTRKQLITIRILSISYMVGLKVTIIREVEDIITVVITIDFKSEVEEVGLITEVVDITIMTGGTIITSKEIREETPMTQITKV